MKIATIITQSHDVGCEEFINQFVGHGANAFDVDCLDIGDADESQDRAKIGFLKIE